MDICLFSASLNICPFPYIIKLLTVQNLLACHLLLCSFFGLRVLFLIIFFIFLFFFLRSSHLIYSLPLHDYTALLLQTSWDQYDTKTPLFSMQGSISFMQYANQSYSCRLEIKKNGSCTYLSVPELLLERGEHFIVRKLMIHLLNPLLIEMISLGIILTSLCKTFSN